MARAGIVEIRDRFAGVTDPRVERTKRHKLLDMIVIALCGAIAGADGWAGDLRICLGQVAVEEKSNEITAVPKLLELLANRSRPSFVDRRCPFFSRTLPSKVASVANDSKPAGTTAS